MSSNSYSTPNQLSLARFAFNIYGALNQSSSIESGSPSSSNSSVRSRLNDNAANKNRLTYNCEREVACVSQYSPSGISPYSEAETLNHVVIGGKNYLKILTLNGEQTRITQETNVLEQAGPLYSKSRIPLSSKLNNINTIKTSTDSIACGLSNGIISIYKVNNNGKSSLTHKFTDHKRCINSLDFNPKPENPNLLISGSQDGSIKLWDLRSSSVKPETTVISGGHSDPVRACQISPHTQVRNKLTVLSAHDSGTLCMHDLRCPGHQQLHLPLYTPERKCNFHTGPALSLHIHPEKEYVITGGRDQKLCIWNYGRSFAFNNTSPDFIVNTYGPVMKVRWSNYACSSNDIDHSHAEYSKFDEKSTYEERETAYASTTNNPLYNYDFACLYLNDDPTLAVFNLKRKYIPKEVITSTKPFQNFIWAKNYSQTRSMWTITKSNVFAAYNLDNNCNQQDISKPLDNLSNVSVTWNDGIGDFCFVTQEKDEFEFNSETDTSTEASMYSDSGHELPLYGESALHLRRLSEDQDASNFEPNYNGDYSPYGSKIQVGSVPIAYSSTATLKNDRNTNQKTPMMHSLKSSPKPTGRLSSAFNDAQNRPSLDRNQSQSTFESSVSINHAAQTKVNTKRKLLCVNYASPYLVPLSLPLPLNDEYVFEALSQNYLISIPDGFRLHDVCLLNASVAASVNRYRDCQVWRMLAVSLEQNHQVEKTNMDFTEESKDDQGGDSRSILSDLGNFVGSYNSNSTLTTNYGGTAGNENSAESLEKAISRQQSFNQIYSETKNLSSHNLMNIINVGRGNSFTHGPNTSSNAFFKNNENPPNDDNEDAIEDDDEENNVNSKAKSQSEGFSNVDIKRSKSDSSLKQPNKISREIGKKHSVASFSEDSSSLPIKYSPIKAEPENYLKMEILPNSKTLVGKHLFQRRPSYLRVATKYHFENSEDLDDENQNILNKAAVGSFSSASTHQEIGDGFGSFGHTYHSYNSHGSFGYSAPHSQGSSLSRRDSVIPTQGFFKTHDKTTRNKDNRLDEVNEDVEERQSADKNLMHSELTRAINESENDATSSKAWETFSLLLKALDYAALQGDIVFCATLTMLFYDVTNIDRARSLEWLSLYVEILQRKRLFVNAVQIIKTAPKDLASDLATNKDLDLRFYCPKCQTLIVNEQSKDLSQGLWYCSRCSSPQPSCIYCGEPCKGLNVVVSLRCGHRGHFGCLREWFVEEENVECPGGCDYSII
ncbi:uncharacterized protein PRCAT00003179001 [Priceomyces carsonii]|uniref:uncharacterized protein n=1 Tax=Priceomyces carsonii TaxID=28549 RepID=UPI002ED8B9FF|nr:unnamed protein product [Priceomyces carsonii]